MWKDPQRFCTSLIRSSQSIVGSQARLNSPISNCKYYRAVAHKYLTISNHWLTVPVFTQSDIKLSNPQPWYGWKHPKTKQSCVGEPGHKNFSWSSRDLGPLCGWSSIEYSLTHGSTIPIHTPKEFGSQIGHANASVAVPAPRDRSFQPAQRPVVPGYPSGSGRPWFGCDGLISCWAINRWTDMNRNWWKAELLENGDEERQRERSD